MDFTLIKTLLRYGSTLPFGLASAAFPYCLQWTDKNYYFEIICQGGANVHVDTVLKTPQFWLLFTTSTLLATGIS
jgi:hypothetical protein